MCFWEKKLKFWPKNFEKRNFKKEINFWGKMETLQKELKFLLENFEKKNRKDHGKKFEELGKS